MGGSPVNSDRRNECVKEYSRWKKAKRKAKEVALNIIGEELGTQSVQTSDVGQNRSVCMVNIS